MKNDALLRVFRRTRDLLARPDNDFGWSSWKDVSAALQEIDAVIETLTTGAQPDIAQLRVLFAPTGPIQEVSLSSGWGDAFEELAKELDAFL